MGLRGEAALLMHKLGGEGLDDAMHEGRCGQAELAYFAPLAELVPLEARAHVCKRARRPGMGACHGLRKIIAGGAQDDHGHPGRGGGRIRSVIWGFSYKTDKI